MSLLAAGSLLRIKDGRLIIGNAGDDCCCGQGCTFPCARTSLPNGPCGYTPAPEQYTVSLAGLTPLYPIGEWVNDDSGRSVRLTGALPASIVLSRRYSGHERPYNQYNAYDGVTWAAFPDSDLVAEIRSGTDGTGDCIGKHTWLYAALSWIPPYIDGNGGEGRWRLIVGLGVGYPMITATQPDFAWSIGQTFLTQGPIFAFNVSYNLGGGCSGCAFGGSTFDCCRGKVFDNETGSFSSTIATNAYGDLFTGGTATVTPCGTPTADVLRGDGSGGCSPPGPTPLKLCYDRYACRVGCDGEIINAVALDSTACLPAGTKPLGWIAAPATDPDPGYRDFEQWIPREDGLCEDDEGCDGTPTEAPDAPTQAEIDAACGKRYYAAEATFVFNCTDTEVESGGTAGVEMGDPFCTPPGGAGIEEWSREYPPIGEDGKKRIIFRRIVYTTDECTDESTPPTIPAPDPPTAEEINIACGCCPLPGKYFAPDINNFAYVTEGPFDVGGTSYQYLFDYGIGSFYANIDEEGNITTQYGESLTVVWDGCRELVVGGSPNPWVARCFDDEE